MVCRLPLATTREAKHSPRLCPIRPIPGDAGMRRSRKKPRSPGAFNEVPPEGLEQSRFSSGNAGVGESGGSKSGNKGAGFGPPTPPATPPKPTDPELAAVVAAWPDLPPAIRAGIAAMVRAAGG